MALSYVEYTGNGSSKDFTFDFDYLSSDHIYVTVDGTLSTAWSLLNATTIRFDPAPADQVVIRIKRMTPYTERLVDFVSTGVLTEEDLDGSANQLFYLMQELLDNISDELSDAELINAATYAERAEAAETNANQYKLDAQTAKTAAELAETHAKTAQSAAEEARDQMQAGFTNANLTLDYPQLLTASTISRGSNNKQVANIEFIYCASEGTPATLSANAVGTALPAGTQPQDTWGIYLVSVSQAGVVSITAGADNFTTGYSAEALAIAGIPTVPTDNCPLGYFTVLTKSGTTFVTGTDDLQGGTSGNVSADTNYYDYTVEHRYVGTMGAAAYTTGGLYVFHVPYTNYSINPVVKLNALTDVTVKKLKGEDVDVGHLPLNHFYYYDGTNFKILTQSVGDNDVTWAKIADGAITPEKLIPYASGSEPLYSDSGAAPASSTNYVKQKELYIPRAGTYKVYMQIKTNNASYTAYGRIYVNGVARGTQRSTTSTTGEGYYEDITVNAGDRIQIYGRTGTATGTMTLTQSGLYANRNFDNIVSLPV